jgi:hypothetical protein
MGDGRTVLLATLLGGGLIAPVAWAQPATTSVQPLLYGVIYGNRGWVAYIEDPLTKTVAPYRVGDAVAGQTVETIEDERVLLKGPGGTMEIHLTYDKTGGRLGPASR